VDAGMQAGSTLQSVAVCVRNRSAPKKGNMDDEHANSAGKDVADNGERSKRNRLAKKAAKPRVVNKTAVAATQAKFPRHGVNKVLRIPKAILEQNAGKDCTDREASEFVGVGFGGPMQLEISSAIKYGFLNRPSPGRIGVTDLARKAIRPQQPEDELNALRHAVINAPDFGDVYKHYRGENLPDRTFFENALTDKFRIPKEKVSEFIELLTTSLEAAKLIEKAGDKTRIIDVSKDASTAEDTNANASQIRKLSRDVQIAAGDSCFIMMPFAAPIGDYYSKIYEPAIRKAGLRPVRADNEIFGTGKIMEQIWNGINSAKVLVAELTKRTRTFFTSWDLPTHLRSRSFWFLRTKRTFLLI